MFESSKWSLPLTFPHQNPVYTPPPILAVCPAHLILLHLIAQKIPDGEYRSLSSSLFIFFHSSLTSSLLDPNILLNTLFSNTLSLCSSLNVSHQVSHPYKTTEYKIIVLCILLHLFLDSNLWDKRFCRMIANLPCFNLIVISFWREFLIC